MGAGLYALGKEFLLLGVLSSDVPSVIVHIDGALHARLQSVAVGAVRHTLSRSHTLLKIYTSSFHIYLLRTHAHERDIILTADRELLHTNIF